MSSNSTATKGTPVENQSSDSNDGANEVLSGKQRRRERNKAIRQIGTHNKTDNSLTEDIPKVSGPIEADRYAFARIMEINDMQSAIEKASHALNELAFQSLPRGLRRRAASHNINRLPARLRAKAARESYSSAPDKPLSRKKVKKIRTPRNTVEEFLRRQKSKKWLETHMWHTKRMKMQDIWGYRIASCPNTKSVRITYRSFTRLSIVHDASYMGCIELRGGHKEIITALNTITDAGSPSVGSERYIKGNRSGSTTLYEYLGYPTKLICPISFLWKPKTKDTIWIWVHPASFHEALTFIKKALEETKSTHVELNDLRDQILRFELTGPRSTALLQSILDPISDNSTGNSVWKDLSQLRSSCSLPPGSVIGLVVQDPRLKFPQKVPPRNNEISVEEQQKIQRILDQWPTDTADTPIWDTDLRKSLFEKKIPEYGLNLRRQKNLVPGTKLQPTAEDSQIPILLIQRGGPTYNKSGIHQQPLSSHELIEGWTVIIPRGFGLAFWKSLVFAGARVAGYDDVRAMHFESGFPCFPQDYPGTRAFEVNRQLVKKAAETIWEKRPPAKRVNHAKRGVEYPFECAFETLTTVEHMEIESQYNLAVRPTYALMHGEQLVSSLLSAADESAYQSKLGALLRDRHLNVQLPMLQLDDALIKVRAKYIDRGKPSANAMVFLLEDLDEYNQCTFHLRHQSPLKKSKRKLKELLEIQTDLQKKLPRIPSKSHHIGYITNGDFSLTLGHGFGVGACTVAGLRKVYALDQSQNRSIKMIVLVRNISSLEVRSAQLEVLC